MKKLIGIFTVLLVFCVSSAFAAVTAEFPAYFNQSLGSTWAKQNGTQLKFTGFTVNSTATNSGKTVGDILVFASNNSETTKSNVFLVNATGFDGGVINGTFYFKNASTDRQRAYNNQTATDFNFNALWGSLAGLTTYGAGNATMNATTYYVPAGNYQMMVGLANSTYNSTAVKANRGKLGQAAYPGRGISMPMVYQNGTFKNSASTDVTWDYYAYGTRKASPVVIYGQVKLNTLTGANNADVKYYLVNASAATDKTTEWFDYNATGLTKGTAGGEMALSTTKSGFVNLFDNATINIDENMVTGFVNQGAQRLFAVMIKSGTTISSSDVKSRAFNLIYAGSGIANQEKGNATAGIMQFNADANLTLTGNARLLTTGAGGNSVTKTDANLGQYTSAIAETSQFQLGQSNMTIYGTDGSVAGYFYGKQSADKVFSVGIYETVATEATYRSLAFLIPTSATTSQIAQAGAGYRNNATFAATTSTLNSTGYTQVQLRSQWSGIPSDFTPLTDVKGYAVTATAATNKGDMYYTAQFKMTGVGGIINKLHLYKVMPTSSASVNEFVYASEATPAVDGAWWISQSTADGYLNSDSVLDPTLEYFVSWVVKDNGNYDANSTALGIIDPVVLGSIPSSSSSSGCVFNPAAGFGLEWLLLMLAPMVAIVRSRFK